MEGGVHRLGQLPGTLVAHPHAPSGGGDRPGFPDEGEKVRPTGAEEKILTLHHPDAECERFGLSVRLHRPTFSPFIGRISRFS